MKMLILASLFTFGSLDVSAFPIVGDSAMYASGVGTQAVTTESKIIAIDGLGGYTKKDTTTIGSESLTVINVVSPSAAQSAVLLMLSSSSEEKCQNLVNGVANATAILETKLVAGNLMQLCHTHYELSQSEGSNATSDMWYGDVPFGLVEGRTNRSSGSFSSVLVSFIKN